MSKKKTSVKEENSHIFPILVLQNIVLTPMIPQPVKIENEEQRDYIDKCYGSNTEIFIATSDKEHNSQQKEKIKEIGLVCIIDRVLQMPGAPTLAFVRPVSRATFHDFVYSPSYPLAKVSLLKEIEPPKKKNIDIDGRLERIETLFQMIMNFVGEQEKQSAEKLIAENSSSLVQHLFSILHVSPISWEEKYYVVSSGSFKVFIERLTTTLDEAEQKIRLQAVIHERTHHELSQQQKEAFLRVHLKHIKEELGESEENDDIRELISKAAEKTWSKETQENFNKEINKFKKLNINNPEYSIQLAYLNTLLELPWNRYNNKKLSLENVEKILDRDPYGLENVKERIMEYMAVVKLRNDLKAPILCLFGPPGVGKTSIGKSVAEAIGREYARISLGGMHDEAEIRGHRKTYIGAMPGRFLQTFTKLKYGNPLILLDEIDKVGKDFKGDPSSALLEALDPEQNNTFHDNYIDYPYDLSKVLFIATANDLSTIPAPLKDRMEIIEMSGYIPAEKREIALKHLVKKSLLDNGFKETDLKFTPEAIDFIIRFYTRESGVRQLEKKIGKIIRKIALLKVKGKSIPEEITPLLAEELLGKKEVLPETYENNEFAGVATGLAWTPTGGEILFIETSLAPGKGEKITLTGNLGEVMKESAIIALQFLKSNCTKLGIPSELFGKYDIHIHVPEGAVPKDGPSAGVTLASSMLSAFTGKKMKDKTAMTGEITLRGKVLPVGGIKEKIIAARQSGVTRIILSEQNRKDIEEIKPQYIEGMEFIYVDTLAEVFKNAILDETAKYHFDLI